MAHLEREVGVQACLAQYVVQQLAVAAAARNGNQPLPCNLLPAHCLAVCQRVVAPHGHHKGVNVNALELDFRHQRVHEADAKVRLPAQHALQGLVHRFVDDAYAYGRVLGREAADDLWQKVDRR